MFGLLGFHDSVERYLLRAGASHGLDDLVEALLGLPTVTVEDLRAQDDAGNTALHLAVQHGHRSVALLLLKHGASLQVVNHAQQRPCDLTDSAELKYELKKAARQCDVMISYRHAERDFALRLREELNHRMITVWLDSDEDRGIPKVGQPKKIPVGTMVNDFHLHLYPQLALLLVSAAGAALPGQER